MTTNNKSLSACPKDQHKHFTDTDTVTDKDTQVPSFCHVDIFRNNLGGLCHFVPFPKSQFWSIPEIATPFLTTNW